MHYKNGREAKVGDRVISKDCNGNVFAGVVVVATPGSDTCNLQLVQFNPAQVIWANAKDSLHAEDTGL